MTNQIKRNPESEDNQEQQFVSDLKLIAAEARRQAYRAADHFLVIRNWLIGRRIVEEEQRGSARAEYGKRVIRLASESLSQEFGKGFSQVNVKSWRKFYLNFSGLQIGQTLLDQFKAQPEQIGQTVSAQSSIPFYTNLSWSHYEQKNFSSFKKAKITQTLTDI